MKKLIIIAIYCILLTLVGKAQDLHFSQFFQSPLTTNPANTGFLPDADFRLGVNLRNQWSSVMSVPYKTMSVYGDAQVLRNSFENGWLGLGGVVLSDVAGAGSLQSTKVYGSIAYHHMLGYSSLLSAGFNMGMANKKIDPSKLVFPDQFDGKFFDVTLPTTVVLAKNNISYFDMQAGINFAYFPTENFYINAGYSIHHVNKPRETFFDAATQDNILPMRHIGFINGIFKLNDRLIVSPNIYYTNQSRASELVGGLVANYNISGQEGGNTQFLAGLYYRHKDAAIGMAGFEVKKVRFLFSYDATISTLRGFNKSRGAYELSIVKKGLYPYNPVDRKVMCPSF